MILPLEWLTSVAIGGYVALRFIEMRKRLSVLAVHTQNPSRVATESNRITTRTKTSTNKALQHGTVLTERRDIAKMPCVSESTLRS